MNKLIAILLRFPNGKYCVIANIQQMFHQVFVIPEDRDALRFIWREGEEEKFLEYVKNVHIFGKVDSPCVYNWSLKVGNAIDKAVIDKFYMDDYLDSFNSLEEPTSTGVCKVLANSGFELTKWSPNSSQIIKTFPESELSPNHKNLDLTEPTIERVIRVLWNSEKEVLQMKVVQNHYKQQNVEFRVTLVLFFLGLLTPVLLRPKFIIQDLWRLKLDWDTSIPSELKNLWLV